ncbi:MAG: phosphoribosylformylglycinamidine synthase [Isosphaeraceae bacterium]|jgi:phosphoribosylformylglycinamidine synthase|nr:MAG: phosphoribosylformylglycinamidine synthase [Isosphaeraceae bacterium]
MPSPRVLVVRAPGTNCDEETAYAWQLAGARPEIWHIARVLDDPPALRQFQILTIPGGFSYGDDLGAGRVLATRLGQILAEGVRDLCERGGLVLGICNGFQVLVRSGLLPGDPRLGPATLARNDSGQFEDRWTRLRPTPGRTPFLTDDQPISMPAAHGEGKFLMSNSDALDRLESAGLAVLHYVDRDGQPTLDYPANPSGTSRGIAGICDPTGRILGLMPHPERNVLPWHDPGWTRRRSLPVAGAGLRLFRNAVQAFD